MENRVKKGIFYGVGVGPGDPELMTLKAVRVLTECPVIAAPQTKSGEMLALDIASGAVDLKDKELLPLFFSMDRDKAVQRTAHERAARAVREKLDEGLDVAMLNLGDVSIYATWCYLMDILNEEGYETVMVPGVPSFCAVAAKLGVSLTEMNSAIHIAPGSGDLEKVLDLSGTKVLMKSGRQLPAVLETLKNRGQLEKTMLIENCGLPGETVCRDLERESPAEGAGYFATLIVKE